MTRTCSQCSANRNFDTCPYGYQDGTVHSGSGCGVAVNGWDIEWKASAFTWRMDSDGDWELYTEGYRYLGLVGANSTRTQWMAFFDLHEIGPFGDIKDAARSLVTRVKGETDG